MAILTDFEPQIDVAMPTDHKWPPQGEWTYEDYRRLPEDGWIYEIIEGELYMSPAPQTRHQLCKGKLFYKCLGFVEANDLGMVLDAPYDVLLPGLASPVQPDVIVVLKERLSIVKEERIEGAPDIVVEVLSPWNWHVDRRKKFTIYAKAGVREYWIVDPQARTIELFGLDGSTYVLIGKYGVGEPVRSEVLSGFEVKVEEVCPA